MLRKLLSVILSVLIVMTLTVTANVFALNDDVDMDMGEDDSTLYQTYAITNLLGKYKTQGRTSIINNLLMVDYSASGIEFSAFCEGDVSLTFNAKSLISGNEGGCYFTVIVDGVKKARQLANESLDDAIRFKIKETILQLTKQEQKIYPKAIDSYNAWIPE